MKSKTKKITVFLALCCSLFISLGIMLSDGFSSNAEILDCETTQTGELKSEYRVGDRLVLPAEKIIYGDKQITPTETLLIMPDGSACAVSECTFDKVGVYKIVYAANENGKTLRSEKSFTVYSDTYSFETTASTIEYQELEMLKRVNSEKIWTDDLTGMHLKLANGDVFTYNKPIDLTANGGNVDIIKLFPWQRNNYMDGWNTYQQVEHLYVRLTDTANPEIYVEYLLNWQGSMLYYRVGTNNQPSIGLCPSAVKSGTVIYLDGLKRRVFTNTWGCTVYPGLANSRPYGNTLGFDVNTNRAYITDSYNKKYLVNDLDSPLIHSEDEFFPGFTTGEVYLSIYGANWNADYADIDITCIGGLTGSALNTEKVEDNLAPQIVIDGNLDNYGDIKIVRGEEFTVPSAKAYDSNLVGEVKTAVYLNYGKDSATRCLTKDGKFVPDRYATYTVEYTARDAYGNTTIKTLDLDCVGSESGKGIDFSVGSITELKAGEETFLPTYTVKGLNKAPTVSVSYIRYAEDGSEAEQTEIVDGVFTPYYKGTYKIVYEYTDVIKTYAYSYTVECVGSDSVAALSSPALPKYVLKGYTYAFDEFFVYSFAEGTPKAELTTMEIRKDDDAAYSEVDRGNVYVSATEKISVRYKFGDWTSDVYEIKVVDVGANGNIKMEQLFQGPAAKTATGESVSYTTEQTGDVVLDFVNVISVSHFNFKYDIPTGYGRFDSLVITLTDFYNADNKVEFAYYANSDNETIFSVGGKESLLSITAFEGTIRNMFYVSATTTVVDTANANVKYPINFASDKAFLSVTLKNVKSESKINIREVNNQYLSNLSVDGTEPEILLGKTEGGLQTVNSIINIYPAELIDVITPVVSGNLTVTVTGPDGKPVKDVNGVTVKNLNALTETYAVKLESYGRYNVVYSFSDQSGNENLVQFFVYVRDSESPVITLDVKNTKAKVGDIVTAAKYSVSDNESTIENITTFISVITPNKEVWVLNDGMFKPNRAGVWTVCYYAYDEAGNHSMSSYEIVVENK